jgi:hypothetical protein
VVPVVVEVPEELVSVVVVDEDTDVSEIDVEDSVVLDVSDVALAVVVEVCVFVTPSPKKSFPY